MSEPARPCHSEVADAPEPLWRRRERSDEESLEGAALRDEHRSFAEPVLSGRSVSKRWEQILRCAQDDREGEGLRMTG
jgi:hypothetical protein